LNGVAGDVGSGLIAAVARRDRDVTVDWAEGGEMTRRIILATALAGALIGVGAGTVSAAQPTNQGCVGASVSALAQTLQPYGQIVLDPNAPRNEIGKVSDAVHAFQAGEVPDSILPNTCN
jgi:hypothetical protein